MNDHDIESDLLDAEFRQILYIIKPHINHINDAYHLEKYRVWLERLSAADSKEKFERNRYLLELANQIHDNVLDVPFTYNPPKGLLPPLINCRNVYEDDPAQISEHFFQKNSEEIQWPFLTPRVSHKKEESKVRHHSSPPVVPKVNSVSQKARISEQVSEKTASPPANHDENSKRHHSSPPILQKKKNSKHRTVRPFQKIGNTGDAPQSESSWCDLTDTTSATQTGGDDNGTTKVLSAQHKEEGLKIQEHFVKKYEENKSSSKESTFNVTEFLASEERFRRPTEQEVEALKMRMKDLLEVKNALRDTHCLTEDRKKTIETLQSKLSQVEQQNSELISMLENQKKKFADWDNTKNKEINDFKEKFAQLREKEIENLKQYHKNEMITLEKSCSSKISELQTQIDTLKKDYEEKLQKVTDSNLSLLKQKENDIQQLRSELKLKTIEPSGEGNGEQLINLKRCISRLDKVLHKNERDYVKKIERLRQELDLKDMTSQMQLQAQRANLIVDSAASKQEELKSALNSLEGKYKKMLENLQTHAFEAKKQDDKMIDELKTLLEKNNIRYC